MFEIFSVPPDAAEATEQMGTKEKFWFSHPQLGSCLFKRAREGSGEDWSEKVASEIAELLGLPHARYELAEWGGRPGVITPSLTTDLETLIHGNELLAAFAHGYPAPGDGPRFRNAEHTIDRVIRVIRETGAAPPPNHPLPPRVTTAAQVFGGYLLLDALIGNSDRHHENWGLMGRRPLRPSLAPRSTTPRRSGATNWMRSELSGWARVTPGTRSKPTRNAARPRSTATPRTGSP